MLDTGRHWGLHKRQSLPSEKGQQETGIVAEKHVQVPVHTNMCEITLGPSRRHTGDASELFTSVPKQYFLFQRQGLTIHPKPMSNSHSSCLSSKKLY